MTNIRHSAHVFVGLCFGWLVLHPAPVLAGEPIALVESISGAPRGVEPMDYLSAGRVISLSAHDGLVIDYLRSCLRETISGGNVTIGTDRSTVNGGHVERERVRCDGGSLNLSPEQAGQSAGMVFRVPPKSHPLPPGTVIERRLYGASPIMDLGGANHVVIERLDRTEAPLDLVIPADRLVRGRFYDLASVGRALSAGGVYRAVAGDHSVVFQIDRTAKPGRTPIAGRLLWF
jgi:hypothetical protein